MGIWRQGFRPMMERGKWKVLRGDKVMITAGKDAGQVGTVLKVLRDPKWPRVIVEGQNLNKRFIKRSKDNPGGIVSVESPLHYSNVALVDPVSGGPVRVATRFLEDGSKVRISLGRFASGSIVPRPDVLKQRKRPRNTTAGPAETPAAVAAAVTHTPGDLPAFLRQRLAAQQQPAAQYHSAAGGGGGLAAATGCALSRRGTRLRGLWRGFAASCVW